jgi:hypothetical protein
VTRLAMKYRDTVDLCVRCPTDRPTVHPDGTGPTTDSEHVVLTYRCAIGHCWTRSVRRADLTQRPAKASAGPRRHLASRAVATTAPTTTTTINDCTDDCTARTRAGRTPAPATGWHPERRLWVPR